MAQWQRERNHHPTRGKYDVEWQEASVSIAAGKSTFSTFNIFLRFRFLFPLIVFGFSVEMNFPFFLELFVAPKVGGGRCNYRNAV